MQIFNKHGDLLATSMPEGSSSFCENDLKGADLRDRELVGIAFDKCDLRGADFGNANLYWAFFGYSDCSECIFRDADLSGAIFDNSNLEGADLRNARLALDNLGGPTDLRGSNLAGVLTEGADFTGATYDDITVFPAGFDPQQNGLVFRDTYA